LHALLKANKPSRFVVEVIIALATDDEGISDLLSIGVNQTVLDLVLSSLDNEKRIKSWTTSNSLESTLLLYFIRMSQHPKAAEQLKSLGAIDVLSRLLGVGTQVAIDSFMSIVFIIASSASEYGKSKLKQDNKTMHEIVIFKKEYL
jgi:hypothetical protein